MSIYMSINFILRVDRKLQLTRLVRVLNPVNAGVCVSLPPQRYLCLTPCHHAVTARDILAQNEGIFKRTWRKIKFLTLGRTQLRANGYYLYESIADKIPYFTFFKEMSLPDTFNSWFLVTELHVWMLMVKAMELGSDGRLIRNFIVESMWADIAEKTKKLGDENVSKAREQTYPLGDQFQAALLSYDEGLLSDDKVLASAVWRRFFERNCSDVHKVEVMVKYIRRQMYYLDNMSEDDFLAQKINWLPLDKT